MKVRRALALVAVLAAGAAPALIAQTADLRAIYGFAPNDIWVVGNKPVALHYDGQNWNEMPFTGSVQGQLNGLWGSGPRNVFAVGDQGTILHYDGATWTRQNSPLSNQNLIAVGGRTATDVFALGDNNGESSAPSVLHYDGANWTASALSAQFHAQGMVVTSTEVVVVGTANNQQAGVVARMSGGRWTVSGWDGQRVTDAVAGGAPWTGASAGGGKILLVAKKDDGTMMMAISGGAGWTMLPPAASTMSGTRVANAFLAGDGTPIALYDGPGFARYTGGSWAAVSPVANMMQQMMQQSMMQQQMMQQQGGRPPAGGQPPPPGQNPQQAMAMQMAANPMMMAARAAAFQMNEARSLWGASATDFYVSVGEGRVTHVVGDDAQIAYDASCSDPMSAQMNPICQMIQMMKAQPPPPPRN